jgi:chromosome partitioning protein
MTISLVNGKGGSGKTTVSVLLASALAQAGHDVAILDSDPQRTATRWIEESGAGVQLAQPGERYPVLVIDTPPRLETITDAIQRADAIVLVTSPSPADLFTSRDTVAHLQKQGVKRRARILFNQVQQGTVLSREIDDMAQRIELPALRSVLHRRQAYQHAVLLGWKALPHEAREEVLTAALEIIGGGKRK